MKILFITLVSISFLLGKVSCPYDLQADTIYNFSKLENIAILSVQGEVYDNLVYGDLDPANSPITYYDNRSAICGGEFNFNRVIVAYCDWHRDSQCWDITLGSTGYKTIINENGTYKNNVIIANYYPCLPYLVEKVTVAFYDYDNNDIGYATLNLNEVDEQFDIQLTEEKAKEQRTICSSEPITPYIDDWEKILLNQKQSIKQIDINIANINPNFTNNLEQLNSINENINEKSENLNQDIDESILLDGFIVNPSIDGELSNFQRDIENTLTNSFDTYSNVFGFGGYGSAPTPIDFDLLGNSYTAFDIKQYDEHIPMIRNTLLSFSYFWGFLLVSRSIK
ncbi:hypothetical protein CP965_01980 [Halarcobacter mediterraneus]|uniref:Uncharacterized protein n=1 Tax=Halarcobacter mediterraneus TaxID=2023153 RepID=A0A4Q1AZ15_9BACT|nr:hypothetical protein [Halarcobacter mediterraneus]RXK14240.1 hypothetical protein CP965_01980 [Halarcobacter mediterraneus]